jgi:hypothetical protein
MATTTPNYGWPVPTSTDFVKDGAQAIEDLGDAIDATVFGLPSGGLTLLSATTIGTAVSSVTVTGAFSATYDNYKIVVTGGTSSVNNTLTSMKLGATATGYYAAYSGAAFSGGANISTDNNASAWSRACVSRTSGLICNLDLLGPNLAKNTYLTSGVQVDVTVGRTSAGYLNDTTQYTDFTLTPAAGTITGGTIRIYGYQNS